MRRFVVITLFIACSSAGCAPAPRAPASEMPATPTPPPARAPAAPLATSTPDPGHACSVELRLELFGSGAQRGVKILAVNRRDVPVTFSLPDRCPNGPVAVAGLPAGYDLYGTCNAGACPGPRQPHEVTLPARGRKAVAFASIITSGKPPCTHALAPGTYHLRPIAPDARFCVSGAQLVVKAAARRADPYACSEAADCVLSCPKAPGCCGYPCGCRHAINEKYAAAYEASYAKTCRKPPCPAVGCAYQPAMSATCRNGRCVATNGPFTTR